MTVTKNQFSARGLDVPFQRSEALKHETNDGRARARIPQYEGVENEKGNDDLGFGAGRMECRVVAKAQIGPKPVNGDFHSDTMAQNGENANATMGAKC
jgi:hypothetical protein